MDNNFTYQDILVRNLIAIAEVNTDILHLLEHIDEDTLDFKEMEYSIQAEKMFHLAACVGIACKFKEAKVYSSGMNKPPETSKERLLLNIRNILDYIRASYKSEQFGLGMLMHINKLFLEDIKDVWEIGKIITLGESFDTTYDKSQKSRQIYTTSAGAFVKSIEEYKEKNTAPTVIIDAFAFYTLYATSLFYCGNDIVSLAILELFNRKDGLNAYVNYYKLIQTIQDLHEEMSTDEWIALYVNELLKEMLLIQSKLSAFVARAMPSKEKYIDLSLRQIRGLTYIKKKGEISREMYAKLNIVSPITSYRDLSNMLQKGYVKVKGIGKGTKYII